MKTLKSTKTYTKIIGIFILSSVVACVGKPSNQGVTSQRQGTQITQGTKNKPPITEAMIEKAKKGGSCYQFLVDRLTELQTGDDSKIAATDPTVISPINNDGKGNPRNLTALHYAVLLEDPDIIDTLCKWGAPLETIDTQYRATPLIWAASNAKTASVQALLDLSKSGIKVNIHAKNINGRSSLVSATEKSTDDKAPNKGNRKKYLAIIKILRANGETLG